MIEDLRLTMSTSTSAKAEKLSESELLSFLLNYGADNNFSIALWRLPNQTCKHIILSHKHQFVKRDYRIEELSEGFIFAPYDKDKESVFLPTDLSFSFDAGEIKSSRIASGQDGDSWLKDNYKYALKTLSTLNHANSETSETDQSFFKDIVTSSLHGIETGTFEKVVISRTKLITLAYDFNVLKVFQKLCNTYPNALVSFVRIPGVGSWLGATPEVLMCLQDKTIFKTVALAGTKAYHDQINLKSVAWTQKEIEEQALVGRYIISCFKKIRLREYEEHGPKTVVAGNLMHLKSDFTVDIKTTNLPLLGSTMLQLLHPTSAVCGMPLEAALSFIKNNEGYDREFYSGYLGPVNMNNNTSIFVNIRCMQLFSKHAILYAGAGITGDSIPEEEWNETELKLNTLLSVIIE